MVNKREPLRYSIRVKSHLNPQWSEWFDQMSISLEEDGTTTLSGLVVDQAALHGLLVRVRDLGLELISVYPVGSGHNLARQGRAFALDEEVSMTVRAVQGAVCFVRDEDKVLLLYRNHDPFEGKWDGITGLVEFGETPQQAARREVLEESGLTVETCEHRGHLLLYNTENMLAISADLFVAGGHRGELQSSEEGLPVWTPISNIANVDFIGFVHITLPLILTPQTFLVGTIQHSARGEVVDCDLCHYQVSALRSVSSGTLAISEK